MSFYSYLLPTDCFFLSKENIGLRWNVTVCKSTRLQVFRMTIVNGGSYMSAHILLNLLRELGKGVKTPGLAKTLSLFRSKFSKGPRKVLMKDCP